MNVGAFFSAWESGNPRAAKLIIPPREARKHQRSRSHARGVPHRPVWARNDRDDSRRRYSFQHYDDITSYMESYRKENAFSTVTADRTDNSKESEIRLLYVALTSGHLPHCMRAVYESYKTALIAVHQRQLMESSSDAHWPLPHTVLQRTVTLQLPLPPISSDRPVARGGRRTSWEERTLAKLHSPCSPSDSAISNKRDITTIVPQVRCPEGVSKLYMEVMHDCSPQEAEQVNWRMGKSSANEDNEYKKTNGYKSQANTEQLPWHAVVGAIPSVVSWLQKLNTARRTLEPLPGELTGTAIPRQPALMKSTTTSDILANRRQHVQLDSRTVEKSASHNDLVTPLCQDQLDLRSFQLPAATSLALDPVFQHHDQKQTKQVNLRRKRMNSKRARAQPEQDDILLHPQSHYMLSFSHSLLIKSQSKTTAEE